MANKRKKQKLGRLLITIGLILLMYWGARTYFRYQALTLEANLVQSAAVGSGQLPTKITIASKFDLEVAEAQVANGKWRVWPTKATYLPVSARPGEPGNIIIYGHNKKSVMGRLTEVKIGDEVEVVTADNQMRKYRVEDAQAVNPSQTELLSPTTYEVLTLYTCTGWLDSQRWVVRAKPVTG